MEAFSLLNYWKNNTSGLTFIPPSSSDSLTRLSAEPTTIVTSVSVTESDEEDEGPFFDLEFAPPLEEDSDFSSSDEADPELDAVYFNGQIVEEEEEVEVEEEEIEPPSSSSTEQTCSVKAPAAQLSASILKSATKLRVFMLKMKKPKLKSEKSESKSESQQKSTVTVNLLKVEEEVPIISLFARDNSSSNTSSSSSSSSTSSSSSLTKKQNGNETCVFEENRFVMMHKYLKKVKPLYVRVSRRYGEKLRHTTAAEKKESPAKTTVVKSLKPGNISINIPAGLKVVRKHLGKSRSSSSTTAAKESTTAAGSVTTVTESRRRDDSLLQQQDSIQSAILHCKRSFNSSRDKDPSVLPRSVSDPSSYEK